MPTYRVKSMQGGTEPTVPSIGKQLANQPATKHAVHQTMPPQDRIVGAGRRVLIEAGLCLNGRFVCRNGVAFDSESGGTAVAYADGITDRVVCRLQNYPITPGNVLRLRVRAEPSGMHHGDLSGLSSVTDAGAAGWIKLEATWDNQSTTTTETTELFIPGSEESNNGEPDGDGESWVLSKVYKRVLRPEGLDFLFKKATTAKWCKSGTTVDITLSYRGSPRPWDVIVYEDPERIAYDDEETGDWVAHTYPEQSYPFDFPRKQAEDSGDVTRGQLHLHTVLQGIAAQLAPAVYHWHSGQEGHGEIEEWADYSYSGGALGTSGDNEAPPYEVTGSSFEVVPESNLSSYATTNPGPGLGCGGYGRGVVQNGDRGVCGWGLRGRSAVIPVRVDVYSKASSSDVTTVRVQSRAHSWIDVTQNGTSYGWDTEYGWLSVGRNPEDDFSGTNLLKGSDGSATASLRNLVVMCRDPEAT